MREKKKIDYLIMSHDFASRPWHHLSCSHTDSPCRKLTNFFKMGVHDEGVVTQEPQAQVRAVPPAAAATPAPKVSPAVCLLFSVRKQNLLLLLFYSLLPSGQV